MDSVVATVIGDITLVFVIASLLGAAARRCGQPAVIGQILAGILLGPSLLGRLPGHLTGHLFPGDAIPYLNVLAQVAVVIFMFAVGYEIEFGTLHAHGRAVPLVALGALFVPMGLGTGCALLFRPEFAGLGIGHEGRSFVLFMGAATSVTALPVLASIVRERNLAGTTAGVVATAAAGIMDVLAWLVLAAALVGTGHAGPFSLPVTVLLLGCFVVVMLAVVRPAVSWRMNRPRSVLYSPVPVAFALAMASAWVTASLGLHPIFGAFLAGLTMRGRNRVPEADVLRAMDQAASMILPLFFVVTGLSLNIGAVRGDAFVLLAVVVVIACAGKLGPGYGISRACGLSRRDSATVAALVNTRGLTELIALNVGLDDGLLNQGLFTVLVLMALITTLATGPLLSVIKPVRSTTTRPQCPLPGTPGRGQPGDHRIPNKNSQRIY
ncbi:MAG TPA: cation:proton antiporter [Trebonia sp.]